MMMAPIAPHVPVLLAPDPRARWRRCAGVWLDGTFGAGGYARALLDAGAARVIGVDRDPEALERAAAWAGDVRRPADAAARGASASSTGSRRRRARRRSTAWCSTSASRRCSSTRRRAGFSFLKDGPLDMRMEPGGALGRRPREPRCPRRRSPTSCFQLGEERASRRIARAIVADRRAAPFATTLQLAGLIERLLPRPKPGQPHAATRSFQALRIAVNDELGELARGLAAAEAALAPGRLAGGGDLPFARGPDREALPAAPLRRRAARRAAMRPRRRPRRRGFALVTRKAVLPDAAEIAVNPRARSAKLRHRAPAGRAGRARSTRGRSACRSWRWRGWR